MLNNSIRQMLITCFVCLVLLLKARDYWLKVTFKKSGLIYFSGYVLKFDVSFNQINTKLIEKIGGRERGVPGWGKRM